MKMRILHTMIRVESIDRSIGSYTRVLGMTLPRKDDYPDGQFTLAFVGYDNETDSAVIELTHNWGVDAYEIGAGCGRITIGVDDACQACNDIRNNDGQVTREAGPMKHGATVVAFVTGPNSYKIEPIQKSS